MKQLPDVPRGFLLGGVLVLAACGATPLSEDVGATGPGGAIATVTGLHFTTSSAFPENLPPTNVDVVLTDLTRSRAIYHATLALPDFPPGRNNCPEDGGYSHTITFMNGQTVAVTAILNAGGCRDVAISGVPQTKQAYDGAYWTLLARNLGVEESTLVSMKSP